MTALAWHTPTQAAPLLGLHPRTVRDLCAARQIECRVTYGPKGQARYHLSDEQIAAYNRTHTVKPRALRRVADPERRAYPAMAALAALMKGLAVTNHMEMPSTIIGKASIKPPANSIWPSSWARISGWRANDSRYFEAMMPQANAVASAPTLRMMPTTHAVLV